MAFSLTLPNFLKFDKLQGQSSVLGIDIGASAIKVVQLKKKSGKAVLETYGAISLGPYAQVEVGRATNLGSDVLATALTDILKESNTTTNVAGIAMPLGSSLLSIIEVPSIGERELASMVPLEARKYIPVPITEVALDWWIIPDETNEAAPPEMAEAQKKDTKKKQVLVVAIHNTAIDKYRQIVSTTGIQSNFFELEAFSTVRAIADQELAPVMLVDIGAGTAKIYIVDRGVIRYSHIVNRGAQDITIALSKSLSIPVAEAEKMKREIGLDPENKHKDVKDAITLTLEHIVGESRQVLLDYEKQYAKNVGKIALCGGGALLKGVREFMQLSFETEVTLGNPFTKTEAPAFLERALSEAGPEFTVAVGVALRKLQELR